MLINRRQFSQLFALGLVGSTVNKVPLSYSASPQIALTMDDFSWQNSIYQSAADRNRAILNILGSNSLKAALFVIGRNVEEEQGRELLSQWNSAGHIIANHTYSHQNFNSLSMTLKTFQDDVLHAEGVLKDFTGFRKYFRFPMLKEGDTALKRDGIRRFLARHGYRIGHVTIDTSDWAISSRLTQRLNREPSADIRPYRDFYLEHMWDRAQYYDSLARRAVGRPVKHTILVHYNLLNGLFLADLIEMFKSKGWRWIDAANAFADPVFSEDPNVLPAGESIVWALAKANHTIAMSLKYPAEDGDIVVEQMKDRGL